MTKMEVTSFVDGPYAQVSSKLNDPINPLQLIYLPGNNLLTVVKKWLASTIIIYLGIPANFLKNKMFK